MTEDNNWLPSQVAIEAKMLTRWSNFVEKPTASSSVELASDPALPRRS